MQGIEEKIILVTINTVADLIADDEHYSPSDIADGVIAALPDARKYSTPVLEGMALAIDFLTADRELLAEFECMVSRVGCRALQ